MDLDHILFNNIKIKTFIDNSNNPWFKGKDVATILGYQNTTKAIRDHVKDKYKKTFCKNDPFLPCNNKNDLKTVYINEPGLYSLVLKSTMKQAEDFQDWIASEVIPSIRKKGEYKLENKITEKLSIEFEQKLRIMDSRISEIQRQSELDKQNAEKELNLKD